MSLNGLQTHFDWFLFINLKVSQVFVAGKGQKRPLQMNERGVARKTSIPVKLIKGLFTPSVSIDANVDIPVDTWKEYIDLNCNIHRSKSVVASINADPQCDHSFRWSIKVKRSVQNGCNIQHLKNHLTLAMDVHRILILKAEIMSCDLPIHHHLSLSPPDLAR